MCLPQQTYTEKSQEFGTSTMAMCIKTLTAMSASHNGTDSDMNLIRQASSPKRQLPCLCNPFCPPVRQMTSTCHYLEPEKGEVRWQSGRVRGCHGVTIPLKASDEEGLALSLFGVCFIAWDRGLFQSHMLPLDGLQGLLHS